jgi:Flp pilus assembly protein TadG
MSSCTVTSPRARLSSERGVSLIHVGIVMFALILMSAFVADQGLMFMTRAQAQNAADAGALAGAISRAFDDPSPDADLAADSVVFEAARSAALANPTYDGTYGTPDVVIPCPAFVVPAEGCVTVNVHRDSIGGSDGVPTLFAPLFQRPTVSVQATATAQAAAANATDCLRPFGVPDLWEEGNVPASPDQFKRYKPVGNGAGSVIADPDVYRDPWNADPTGYNLDDNFGTELRLAYGPGGQAGNTRKGWYMPLDVTQAGGGSPGANGVIENIQACNGVPVPLLSTLPIEPGAAVGPINMGIEDLIAQDPDAFWDGDSIEGSCVPQCGSFSPRTITLAVFDPDKYQFEDTNNQLPAGCSKKCVTVVGFLGFFVDRMEMGDVIGYLVRVPGVLVNGGPPAPAGGAFTTAIRLVR